MADATTTVETGTEQWADCPGYPGLYRVSSEGRVLNTRTGVLLKGHLKRDGYRQVRLSAPGRRPRCFYVHRLVAVVFHGLPPPGFVVDHISGLKHDCSARNLKWVTPTENVRRAFKLGLMRQRGRKGESHPKAKLTDGKVRAIRAEWKSGATCTALAKKYGVSHASIRAVVHGKSWRHVAEHQEERSDEAYHLSG